MKVFKLPQQPKAVFFDMDNTLYTHDEYAKSQIDLPVKRLAEIKGKSFEKMNEEVLQYRKDWADGHEGRAISLGNALKAFGVTIEDTIKWREELYRPEDYLKSDAQLQVTMRLLSSCFSLAVVTNNPVSVAVRTFTVLGVHDILRNIVGLDTFHISKPDKRHFLKAAELCGVQPEHCISVGDRYDIDLAIPLELGMGGILVDGVKDIYELPELLAANAP
jgi:phosphoglycolate phosphatase/putative hydrolase of the HAD superfamily